MFARDWTKVGVDVDVGDRVIGPWVLDDALQVWLKVVAGELGSDRG